MQKVILIRHGESHSNVNGDFGAPDYQQLLTPKGIRQLLEAGSAIAGTLSADEKKKVQFLTSESARAVQSAMILSSCLDPRSIADTCIRCPELNELHSPLPVRQDFSWFDYQRWLEDSSYPSVREPSHWRVLPSAPDAHCVADRVRSVRSYDDMRLDIKDFDLYSSYSRHTLIVVAHHFSILALLEKYCPGHPSCASRDIKNADPIYL